MNNFWDSQQNFVKISTKNIPEHIFLMKSQRNFAQSRDAPNFCVRKTEHFGVGVVYKLVNLAAFEK